MEANRINMIPVEDLYLDWSNPRIPIEEHDADRTQEDLAALIDKKYDPLSVARSIERHGFFPSEPIVAILEGGRLRVLEGNRRVTALKSLRDPELRKRLALQNKGWERFKGVLGPAEVPTHIVKSEESVDALLGFRHISGIDPWSPYQQAQFVTKLVEEREMSFDAVAEVVGRSGTEVRSMYRDFDILRYATSIGYDTQLARGRFAVLTVAMSRPTLREVVGAQAPRDVNPEYEPVDPHKAGELAELLGFLFGTSEIEPVIGDSRLVQKLVLVYEDPSGAALQVLRETRDLAEALDSLGGSSTPGTRALELANWHLERSLSQVGLQVTPEYQTEFLRTVDLVAVIHSRMARG